jgi:hypothetical protein
MTVNFLEENGMRRTRPADTFRVTEEPEPQLVAG